MRAVKRDDSGVVAIIIAISMVLLCVVGAFAVDFGLAYNERRADQNTVDAGALSGAGSLPADLVAATAAVKSYVNENIDPDITDAEWTACTDSQHLAIVSAASQCISFSAFHGRVRVLLPTRKVHAMLASAAGFRDIPVSALAEASVIPDGFGAGVLPFGLTGSAAANGEVCLKTGSQPNLPPCNGPADGNFGTLDFSWFGNPLTGTPTSCAGGTQTRLAGNILLGVDHALDAYNYPDSTPPETGDITRDDRAMCLASDPLAYPNQTTSQTGLGSNLDDGLVVGATIGAHTYNGRLARVPAGWPTKLIRKTLPQLDNRPLWDFIDPALTSGIPSTCRRSVVTSKATMQTCFNDYVAGSYSTPLFTVDTMPSTPGPDLQSSPRFAFVPELWETTWGSGGSGAYEFKRFRPVFIQTLYFKCNSGSGGCSGIFDPGETYTGVPLNRNDTLEAITALQIPINALPDVVRNTMPGFFKGNPHIVLTH